MSLPTPGQHFQIGCVSDVLCLFSLSWGGLSRHFWLSGLITITAITRRASSVLVAEECFKLRCDAEYLQIPLTQEATATTVTEGTETLPETKKMNQRCLIIDVMKMILQGGKSESGKQSHPTSICQAMIYQVFTDWLAFMTINWRTMCLFPLTYSLCPISKSSEIKMCSFDPTHALHCHWIYQDFSGLTKYTVNDEEVTCKHEVNAA